MLLPVAVLATGVRKHHGVIPWLLIPSTEALIPRKFVLSVAVVAVGTSPAVEGDEGLRLPVLTGVLCILLFLHVVFFFPDPPVVFFIFLLLFFSLFEDSILASVELVDPPFNTPEMEGLAALEAVPESASLVNRVGADDALLGARGEALDQVLALVGEVLRLLQEVFEVVSH